MLPARVLLGLEGQVAVMSTDPVMDDVGWRLRRGGHRMDVHQRHAPSYPGRATVPLLVDERRGKAVNNEAADIIGMFDEAFASSAAVPDSGPGGTLRRLMR